MTARLVSRANIHTQPQSLLGVEADGLKRTDIWKHSVMDLRLAVRDGVRRTIVINGTVNRWAARCQKASGCLAGIQSF